MNLRVQWSAQAVHALKKIPRADAERIARDVLRFAATSDGETERLVSAPAPAVRLRVGGYVVVINVGADGSSIMVAWVYRTDR